MAIDSPPNLRWTPFVALFMREVRRFMKIFFQTVATPLISVTLYLMIFGVSIGRDIQEIKGFPYIAFLLPGLIAMTSLRNSFDNATGSIVTSKFCGEMEDFRIAPLSPLQITWANGLAATFRGFLVATTTLIIGEIFCYIELGHWLTFHSPGLLILFLLIGGFSYANLGMSISMLSKNFDQVNSVNMFILMPLIYLGGVFFSLQQLHPFWQKLSQFNPLLYLVNGVRYSIIGVSDVNIGLALGVSIVTLIFFNTLAVWSLKVGSYHRW